LDKIETEAQHGPMTACLEGPHRIHVLLFLLENGPKSKTEIWTGLKISPAVFLDSVLPPLLEGGIVVIQEEHRGLRRAQTHVVGLTVFGRKVAEALRQVDDLIRTAKKHAKTS